MSKINPARLLNSAGVEAMTKKEGYRRTIYYTKKREEGGYARQGQYLGEWKNNKWDGKGTLEMANGKRYVGGWAEGKRAGIGTLWVRGKDGKLRKIYSGQWENDQQHGRGVCNYAGGVVYNGEFKNGLRHGVGICTYSS